MLFKIQYGQRGLRIYCESSWCEIDRGIGLTQVTRVNLRILAIPFPTCPHRCGFVVLLPPPISPRTGNMIEGIHEY